ncbi:hypothetical protein AMS68_000481 [Peltaster fructicola]|uniref:Actin-like ATPase domain-containing protein n=1 Tax=Peltaster fructicola TaxID=286661 RepID=A0A6H0XJR8_9PEZI|nr:hypothetical protein AMS68_000481 [Peltaster fructicola]
MAGQRPDIVVGIDIGQTCSGVAYSLGPDWSHPLCLNKWPSANGLERADKVATRVGYSKDTDTLVNWGFESSFDDRAINVREQFKLTLDEEWVDDRGYTYDQARQWYHDYLRCLYGEIERFFDIHIPRWRELNVEYNFSAPTTWRSPAMVSVIENMIKTSGYTSTPRQTMRMSLTEAEAAAIDAAVVNYNIGDIFLICDAGGGTTDVNLLRVKSTEGKIELEPLDCVEGKSNGSTLIDFHMTQHIRARLELIQDKLDGDLDSIVHDMLQGKYMTLKHSFPAPRVEKFWLDVKGLAGAQTFEEAGIKDSRMSIDRDTLKEMFDIQVAEIFELIDDRFYHLARTSPDAKVSYVILSGGLGSSPYLHEELKRRYEMNFGFRSSNTAITRIMKVPEPQLAVVKGLVRERTQQLGNTLSAGQEVFQTRRCRNSYGMVVRVPYTEALHRGLPVTVDPNDGGQWVDHMVDWFIKQGEEVDVEQGIRREYGATMSEAECSQQRQARIVMSREPADQLPRLKTQSGCEELVLVKYTLTGNDMKLKNRQPWKLKKKFWKANFTFVVKLGPTDLRFQILGRNGLLSSDHDSMQVEFMDPAERRTARPVSQMPLFHGHANGHANGHVDGYSPQQAYHSSY